MDARAIISHVLLLNEENGNWYSDNGGVFVLGRSLGGAVAAQVISELSDDKLDLIDGLILENIWTNLDDFILDYIFLSAFRKLVLRNYWDTLALIPSLNKVPLMYVAGNQDKVVSGRQAVKIVNAIRNLNERFQPHYYESWYGGHTDTWFKDKRMYIS